MQCYKCVFIQKNEKLPPPLHPAPFLPELSSPVTSVLARLPILPGHHHFKTQRAHNYASNCSTCMSSLPPFSSPPLLLASSPFNRAAFAFLILRPQHYHLLPSRAKKITTAGHFDSYKSRVSAPESNTTHSSTTSYVYDDYAFVFASPFALPSSAGLVGPPLMGSSDVPEGRRVRRVRGKGYSSGSSSSLLFR